jgi:diaminohydroxyphosphoribosylaminopyrimidine deaminase/5-amino-6-(5-phosphoribosylamino)uracil reductase
MDGKISHKLPLTVDAAMKLAIQEAYKGSAFVSPNPKVGCVILDSRGHFLASGYHKICGGPHAEVEALNQLRAEQLQGAHIIVTLEPCAHQGRTPSCAKTLAQLPIKRVTYGIIDPNPLVSGRGHKILADAGKQVDECQGPLKIELEKVCEEFLINQKEKRIFVALKVAQSLDGKIALQNGKSQWITGPESREFVQELRAQYDAILVGRNTILADNPSLNVRREGLKKDNHVVVWGNAEGLEKLPRHLKIFQTHPLNHIHLESGSLQDVLQRLYDQGLRSLLVEGGGKTYSSFLKEALVDRLHVFTAPLILGQGIGWSELIDHSDLARVHRMRQDACQTFGQDQYMSFKL